MRVSYILIIVIIIIASSIFFMSYDGSTSSRSNYIDGKMFNLMNRYIRYSNESRYQTSHNINPVTSTNSKLESNDNFPCQQSYALQCDMYNYVRFWNKKFKLKDCFESPARHPLKKLAPIHEQKYLLFEPDRGGWNNIRMAAETAMIFAHASGRVLVLPPKARWYLLTKNRNEVENESSFETFFDLKKISESLDMISMVKFLELVAIPGLLKAPYPDRIPAKAFAVNGDRLWQYLETACYVREWEPGKMFIGFNISSQISPNNTITPIFGNITLSNRTKRFAAHNREILPYSKKLHDERAIYFPGDYRNTHRILTHFYSYIYFAQPEVERAYKRLVRDRLHYRDDIFCAAGRAIRHLHNDASEIMHKPVQNEKYYYWKTGGGMMSGLDKDEHATYFAYHIRRGDFQYKDTRLTAETLWENTKHLLNINITSLIYIATDETNHSFFQPFMTNHYTVKFLHNYIDDIQNGTSRMNHNHIGMIEQVICANAHTFIGTPYSTFTGYITRMRGYYRDGRYLRTYYSMPSHMYQLHLKPDLVGPFWAREFAVAHRKIDDDSPANNYVV